MLTRLRRFASKKPTGVWVIRYEREDGEFREINVPQGFGRFRRATEAGALELADRRLKEQYGPFPRELEEAVLDEDGHETYDSLGHSITQTTVVWDGVPVHHVRDPVTKEILESVERPDLCQSNYKLVSVTRVL